MDIFTDKDLEHIEKRKNEIEKLEIKPLEKSILIMNLFDSFYGKLFEAFQENIHKHLMYIKAKTEIEFVRVKYLHYLKNNHKDLYDKFILLVNEKQENYSLENKTDSIKYYNKNNSDINLEKRETENLLECLDIKKENIKLKKDLTFSRNLNILFSIFIFILLFALFLKI